MRTWSFPEVRPPGEGPWSDEPDKAQWIDEASGLDCLIVRASRSGSLCGYVGVPPEHPWYRARAHTVNRQVRAAKEINFAGLCREGADGRGVCHVPEPGRPADVWWLGFDCGHSDDVTPTRDAREARTNRWLYHPGHGLNDGREYRTFAWVQNQVTLLALQAGIRDVSDTFVCGRCGRTLIKGWSDAEAQAEYERNMPETASAGHKTAKLCEDCYPAFMAWYDQEKAAGRIPDP